jgi:hypothetical protein
MKLKTALVNFMKELNHTDTLSVPVLIHLCKKHNLHGHLAVLSQPYLNRILSGEKTIESRFCKVKSAPFHKANPDDIIILKETSGPILGVALVSKTEFIGPMLPDQVREIMDSHQNALTLDEAFKKLKENSKYVSLLWVSQAIPTPPITLHKSNRQSWIVLN